MCAPAAPAAPTQTSQVTIPEYAKPTVERMIGKGEALTGTSYQPYRGERISGPEAAQLEARQDVRGMEAPQQYGMATNLASSAGLRALNAGQYSPSQFTTMFASPERAGASAFGTGQAVQYMSPFMQNVVDVQKAAAIRDAQKAQLAQNLGAARQGSYGGARQLLATGEREKALGAQLADIQARGLQTSFEQAQQQFERDQARQMAAQQLNVQSGLQAQLSNQQAMLDAQRLAEQSRQFGADVGLRGATTGIQGAQVLGQLGTSQQQAALDLAKAQEAFGSLTQAEKQKQLDTAYQDFLAQQQHPYKQLGFLSDLLRGSANLAGTGGKAVYEAPPSLLAQAVGPGLLGLGLYREFAKS